MKGIKHNEKMGTLGAARALLARLKNVAIDRSWRTIMEGGMLEARQGNIQVARQIFKYLVEKVKNEPKPKPPPQPGPTMHMCTHGLFLRCPFMVPSILKQSDWRLRWKTIREEWH